MCNFLCFFEPVSASDLLMRIFGFKSFGTLLTSFSLPRSWTLKVEINHFKVNNVFALIFMLNLSEYWNK